MDLTQTALDAPQHSVSLLALFMQSSLIVKLVMIGLVAASVWCWAIILDKVLLYRRVSRRMDAFEASFWSGQSLDTLYAGVEHDAIGGKVPTGMAALFLAAMQEWKRSHEMAARAFQGLQMRIEKGLDVALAREVSSLESSLLVLATVGSAAPFVGLFGTVWGIMTSFQAIAGAQNASLAVVAPGIAEALLATALGLLAAIPATIAYNRFAAQVQRLSGRLEGFADEFSAIISRQIDAQAGQQAAARARAASGSMAAPVSARPSQGTGMAQPETQQPVPGHRPMPGQPYPAGA